MKLYRVMFIVDDVIEGEDELDVELKMMEMISYMSTGQKFSCMETTCLDDDNKEELEWNTQ